MSGSKISFRQRIALEAHRSYRRKCVAEHKLNTLFWECTLKCNLACKHCGSDCHVDSAAKELSGEEFLRVVDSITPHVDPHKVLVIFTGGEALVRQDLDAIGLELYRRGYPWGIVTNGCFSTKSVSRVYCAAACIPLRLVWMASKKRTITSVGII